MEDKSNADEPAEEETKATTDSSDLSAMIGKMGSNERLVAAGAAVIAIDYLLFRVILEEYFFSSVMLLVAGYVLFAVWVRHNRPSAAWPLPYVWLLRVAGFTVAFLGVIEFLSDIRSNGLDEAGEVIGGLILYAAAFTMFWGARQMKDSSDS